MTIIERLAELGVELPEPAAPVASFEPFVATGDLVVTSGQIATAADGTLQTTGRVGSEVDVEQAKNCARLCAINVLAQLEQAPGGLESLDRIIKLTVFVASAPGFNEQHIVANGASDLMVQALGDRGRHARSAIGVAELPLGSPVEIEAIVRWRHE